MNYLKLFNQIKKSKESDIKKESANKDVIDFIALDFFNKHKAIFRGGTCLKKTKHLQRYSYDIDLSIVQKLPEIKKIVNDFVKVHNDILINYKFETSEDISYGEIFDIKTNIKSFTSEKNLILRLDILSIKNINCNFADEKIIKLDESTTKITDLFRVNNYQIKMRCIINEITLVEKILALESYITKNKNNWGSMPDRVTRHIHDIHFLIQQNIKFDQNHFDFGWANELNEKKSLFNKNIMKWYVTKRETFNPIIDFRDPYNNDEQYWYIKTKYREWFENEKPKTGITYAEIIGDSETNAIWIKIKKLLTNISFGANIKK